MGNIEHGRPGFGCGTVGIAADRSSNHDAPRAGIRIQPGQEECKYKLNCLKVRVLPGDTVLELSPNEGNGTSA